MAQVLDLEYFNSLSLARMGIIVMALKGYKVDKFGNLFKPNGELSSFYINKSGYPCHAIKFRKRSIEIRIHRYQAFKKFGLDLFEDSIVVRHKNHIKHDNSWDNILIGTAKDNYHDNPKEVNLRGIISGVNAMANKVRDGNYHKWVKIYRDRDLGMSYKDLSKKYSVSKSSLSFHFGNGKMKVDKEYARMIREGMNQ